jgi:hypothetical protein
MPSPSRPTVRQLLDWQDAVARKVTAEVAAVPQGKSLPLPLAVELRDAAMMMTAFGQSSLAQRGLALATAKAMAHAQEPCTRPNCAAPHICKGNGYQVVEGPAGPIIQLSLPHHKTKVAGPVLPLTGREAQVVALYEMRGRPALLLPGRPDEVAMYLTTNGAPFTDEGISAWWKEVHR